MTIYNASAMWYIAVFMVLVRVVYAAHKGVLRMEAAADNAFTAVGQYMVYGLAQAFIGRAVTSWIADMAVAGHYTLTADSVTALVEQPMAQLPKNIAATNFMTWVPAVVVLVARLCGNHISR